MVQGQERALRDLHKMGFRSIRVFGLPWGPSGPEAYSDPVKREKLYAAIDKTLELCDRYEIRPVWSLERTCLPIPSSIAGGSTGMNKFAN